MTNQQIYLAVLICLIIITIFCVSFFIFGINRNYLLPIIPLIITGLYIFLPAIIYVDSITEPIFNTPIFKILSSLILISISSISILASLYANNTLDKKITESEKQKYNDKINLGLTITSSISSGMLVILGIYKVFYKDNKYTKKSKVFPNLVEVKNNQ